MDEAIEGFPLFPLGIVLLPGESVPLHIFEERYKTMVGECIEREREFGIVWLSGDSLASVGCAARVPDVLERFDDGRMNIVAEGTGPIGIEQRIHDLPYPAGRVTRLEDEPGEPGPEVIEKARAAYVALVEGITDERPAASELTELGAYGMAATIAFDPEPKQELLELRSEHDRLERLATLCDDALRRYERSGEVAEVARANGHVRP